MYRSPVDLLPIGLRPTLLAIAAAIGFACGQPAAISGEPPVARGKPPFCVLYSNDATHITTCTSPYHRRGEPWRPEMLAASVDEVAGKVDAHLIQLASGQVPWYRSRVYPMAEHRRWWQSHFGVDPLAAGRPCIEQYLLDGGDPLRLFVDRCRKTGQSPFVSLRLNDVHHVEHIHTPGNQAGFQSISRFYVEHQHCRVAAGMKSWNDRTLNWACPEVPDYMFSLIREQCEDYDLDGFELDFMRHPSFFRQQETTSQQRAAIMTGFVKRVRGALDASARPGRRRWLCLRVPCLLEMHDRLGIDLPAMVAAGADMVNLSAHYFTVQQTDMAEIRRLVPEAGVYLETCHTTRVGPAVSEKSKYDNFSFRRTTPFQYYTAAHLAYARGLDGLSTFNFVYYREHGVGERGPFAEPPFEVLGRLDDRQWLARQPQHYVLSATWITNRPLPRTLRLGQAESFALDLAPPAGGWKQGGRLRIQSDKDLGASVWRAVLNGVELQPTEDRREPYDNPYPPLLGGLKEHRAWLVPAAALRNGRNTIDLTMREGKAPARLVFIDLAAE